MKTTIEISDNLLIQEKQLAHEEQVTLRSIEIGRASCRERV